MDRPFMDACNRHVPGPRSSVNNRAYLDAACIREENKNRPLFRSTLGKSKRPTSNPLMAKDVCRMVKRRLKDDGLPSRLSPHSLRVTGITDLLTQGLPLYDVQYLAGHSSPRTTKLYDRRQKKVTRNIVERISI
jgi:integrase/recombinase XerD